MTSLSNSFESTRPVHSSVGRVFWEELLAFLDFTCNYKQKSGFFVPWAHKFSPQVSYADNLWEQFGPRSGQTKCRT